MPCSIASKQISLNLMRILKLLTFSLLVGFLTSCESTKTIVNGLDEKEANEILVFLSGKGIDANKVQAEGGGGGGNKEVRWNIVVKTDQVTEAMSLLNQAGLPRRRGQNLLGIFGNVGLVPSDLEQKIRYEAGLAEQIASTIRKIDGVLDAEVQISFPQEDPLNPGQYKGKITSSVYVKHSGVLDDPNSHLISKIKRLVASSITGLSYDDVTVIPDRARYSELLPGGGGTMLSEEDKQYVDVWSIILAKDSVMRFQLIFFSFVLAILVAFLALIWVLWKVSPLLRQHGGFSQLFSLRSIKANEEKKGKKGKEEADEDEDLENEKDVDI